MWWLLGAAFAVEEAWVRVEALVTSGSRWAESDRSIARDVVPWAVLPDGSVLAQVTDQGGGLHLARCGATCEEIGAGGLPDDAPDQVWPMPFPPARTDVVHPDGSHLLLLEVERSGVEVIGVWRFDGAAYTWKGEVVANADHQPEFFGRVGLAEDGTFARVDVEGVLWLEGPDGAQRRVAGPGDPIPGTDDTVRYLKIEGVAPGGLVVWSAQGNATAAAIVRSDALTDTPVDVLAYAAIDWMWTSFMRVNRDGATIWAEVRSGTPSWWQVVQDGEVIATSWQGLDTVRENWLPDMLTLPAQAGMQLVVSTPLEGTWNLFGVTVVEHHLVASDGTRWRSRLSDNGPSDLGRASPARWEGVLLNRAAFDATGDAVFACQHTDGAGYRRGTCALTADDRAAFVALDGEPMQLDGESALPLIPFDLGQRMVIGANGRVATTVALSDGRNVLVAGDVADIEVREPGPRDLPGCDTAGRGGAWMWVGLLAWRRRCRGSGRAGSTE